MAILPRFDIVRLDIEILDINDHAPSFSVNTTTRHVIESATPSGPVFLLPVAEDQDGGNNGALEYHLLPESSPFRLVEGVGGSVAELTVELVEPLDREAQ